MAHCVDQLNEGVANLQIITEDSAEVQEFKKLPTSVQRRLLYYPRVLANSALQYGMGTHCDKILQEQLEAVPEFLSVSDRKGDSAVALSLMHQQPERSEFLIDVANSKNPKALQHRSNCSESLSMLSTMLGDEAKTIMPKLLAADPGQVHRLYDNCGQNLLHHCVMENSLQPLESLLAFISDHSSKDSALQAQNVVAMFHMRDTSGNTPIHLAAARNRVDMLKLIDAFAAEQGLKIDFDLCQHVGDRRTPLMEAAAHAAADACQFLKNYFAILDEEEKEEKPAAGGTDPFSASSVDSGMWSGQLSSCDTVKANAAGSAAQQKMSEQQLRRLCSDLRDRLGDNRALDAFAAKFPHEFETNKFLLEISADKLYVFLGCINGRSGFTECVRQLLTDTPPDLPAAI